MNHPTTKEKMSSFTIEQLNLSQYEDDSVCSYNVGKYLKSAAIEMEVSRILCDSGVDVEITNHVCDTIVDHFATAMYLEANDR